MADINTLLDNDFIQIATPSDGDWKLEKSVSDTDTSFIMNFEPKDQNDAAITKDFLIQGTSTISGKRYTETMTVTAISGTTITVTRGIARGGIDFDGDVSNAISHSAGTIFTANLPAGLFQSHDDALRGIIEITTKQEIRPLYGAAASGANPVFANATARDAALTSPQEGDRCRVTALGSQEFDGTIWVTFGVATPVTASLGVEKVGNDLRADLLANGGLVLNGNEIETDKASQAEAEAGSDNTKVMTPLRVAQASEWSFVSTLTFTSEATTKSFSSLTGAGKQFRIEYDFTSEVGGTTTVALQLNGNTDSNYSYTRMVAGVLSNISGSSNITIAQQAISGSKSQGGVIINGERSELASVDDSFSCGSVFGLAGGSQFTFFNGIYQSSAVTTDITAIDILIIGTSSGTAKLFEKTV